MGTGLLCPHEQAQANRHLSPQGSKRRLSDGEKFFGTENDSTSLREKGVLLNKKVPLLQLCSNEIGTKAADNFRD